MTTIDVAPTEASPSRTTAYDFGRITPASPTTSYDSYLLPVAWRATWRSASGPALAVKTSRVGMKNIVLILPHPVPPGATVALGLDLPPPDEFVTLEALEVEGVVSSCVLRGEEGFRVHVNVRRFPNPRHRERMDRYMRERQGVMIYAPL